MEGVSCPSASAAAGAGLAPVPVPVPVPERLQRREQDRQLDVEKRRQQRQSQAVEEEKSGFFASVFARERAAVEALLQPPGAGDRDRDDDDGSPERLEEAASRLQDLRKLLNDSMLFLAAYDVRQGQEALAQLQAVLAERRRDLQPKKRFAFKARRREAAAAAPAAPAAPSPAPGPRLDEGALAGSWACGFSNLQSRVLEMSAAELHQRDILLTQLSDCTVRLCGNPNTLRLAQARGCKVLCGPVSTSVFLEDCSDCVLAVACQQLRVHTSTDVRVFLQVTCRAIVEDCSRIRFAPYTWSYPGLDEDFRGSGLDRSKNNWDDVDDFNWLARGVPSPNWSILPEEEREIPWD